MLMLISGSLSSSLAWLSMLLILLSQGPFCVHASVHRRFDDGFLDETTLERFPGGVPPGVHYSSVSWNDYDNDGRMDFLMMGYDGLQRYTILYKMDDTERFTDVTSTAFPQGIPGLDGGTVSWTDYNNDQLSDVMIIGSDDLGETTYTMFYRQSNDNTFQDVLNETFSPVIQGLDTGSISWMDYDGNGLVDVLLTGARDNGDSCHFYLYSQTTAGSFYDLTNTQTFPEGVPPGVCFSSTDWADYNNDDRPDFLLVGYDGIRRFFRLYSQVSPGQFENVVSPTTFPDGEPPGVYFGWVTWGNFLQSSEYPGFAMTGYDGSNPITKLYGQYRAEEFVDMTDLFTFPQGLPEGVLFSYAEWVDFDNNGLLDLWVQGGQFFSDRSGMLLSQSVAGEFTDVAGDPAVFPAGRPVADQGQASWADINGDGYADFILTGVANETQGGGGDKTSTTTLYIQVPKDQLPGGIASGPSQAGGNDDDDGDGATWLESIPLGALIVIAVFTLSMCALVLTFLLGCFAIIVLGTQGSVAERGEQVKESITSPRSEAAGHVRGRVMEAVTSPRAVRDRITEFVTTVRTPRTPRFNHEEL